MTQPAEPPQNAPPREGFSAEDTTERALTGAVAAAVAVWLAAAAAAVLAGAAVPNLALLPEGTRFVADAMRRIRQALDKAWLTVFARTGTDLRPYISAYLQTLPYRLDGLSHLANRRVTRALADAQQASASIEKMRAAVRKALDPDEYGGYVDRVAQTEASMAVNLARHEIALAAFQRGATVEKSWQTRRDAQVRETHRHAQGQTVPFEAPFWVGGFPMQHPGDPTAPPSETASCRCVARYTVSGGRRR